MTKAYLLGALHDGTKRHLTFRIAQKSQEYVEFIAEELKKLGYKAWTYKEGQTRSVFIVEFSKHLLKDVKITTVQDKIDYLRGYFDAEGGIARQSQVRYYLYFAQKDISDLEQVRDWLLKLGISCGKIHNPSKRVDPNYWRFFIAAKSYIDFAHIIGSWHPVKKSYLRMKI